MMTLKGHSRSRYRQTGNRNELLQSSVGDDRFRRLIRKWHGKMSFVCHVLARNSGVTRVGVTRGGNWRCHSYFFLWKKLATFFSHRYKVRTFFSCRLVTTPQLPSSDIVLSSVLSKFGHNFFPFGCHPWMVLSRAFYSPLLHSPHP